MLHSMLPFLSDFADSPPPSLMYFMNCPLLRGAYGLPLVSWRFIKNVNSILLIQLTVNVVILIVYQTISTIIKLIYLAPEDFFNDCVTMKELKIIAAGLFEYAMLRAVMSS